MISAFVSKVVWINVSILSIISTQILSIELLFCGILFIMFILVFWIFILFRFNFLFILIISQY